MRTPYLYLRNGSADFAQICREVGSPLATRFSRVMGDIPHCSLHVRTGTPHTCISGMAWPILLKFVVHLEAH